jgi:SulP family sulfate permease
VTFVLTVLVDLVVAVNIGVILATLNFLRRMAASVEVCAMNEIDLQNELAKLGMTALPHGVLVFSIDGPFFFAAAETFKRALTFTQCLPRVLILRLERVPFIDITGIDTLAGIIRELQQQQVRIILTGANQRLTEKLGKAGLLDLVGISYFTRDFSEAMSKADK